MGLSHDLGNLQQLYSSSHDNLLYINELVIIVMIIVIIIVMIIVYYIFMILSVEHYPIDPKSWLLVINGLFVVINGLLMGC